MTIYSLKPKFQGILRPAIKLLADNNITPNQITWLALFLSLFFGLLIAYTSGATWILFLLPLFLFIRMALNAIDGMLAREHDMQTASGAILNELSDVFSDIALYLPFALINGIDAVAVTFFIIVAILTEMTGILSQTVYNTRRYEGPMGKSDRAFMMGGVSILIGLEINFLYINILFVIGIILGLWTIYNRALAK